MGETHVCLSVATMNGNKALALKFVVSCAVCLIPCSGQNFGPGVNETFSVNEFPVSVSRRQSADLYWLLNYQDVKHQRVCNENSQTTYLVADGQCVAKDYFFSGKMYFTYC